MADNFPEMILNNNDFDVPAGLYRVTEDGKLLSANYELAKMFGFNTTQELLNRSVTLNYVFPEHRDNLLDQIKANGFVKDFKTRMRKKDGSEFWVSVSARAHQDGNKRLIYYDGIVQDINEQITAEQILEKNEEKFRNLFRSIKDAILVADKERIIIDCNPAFTELFGYSIEEISGKNTSVLYDDPVQYNEVGEILRSRVPTPIFKSVRFRTKSGHVFTGETGIFYQKDVNDKITGYIGSIRDISERLKFEESIMLAKNKAEEADRLKTAFLANVSHEIRTPMNSIIGFSEFLNDPHISREDLNDFINIIQQNGNSLIHLIDDIMDMAKIDAGELRLDMQEYEVNDLLTNMFNTIVPGLKLKSSNLIKPVLNLPNQDKNLNLKTDVQRIRQILYNLLSNAFKFTDRGTIELGYKLRNNGEICIYVKDTGIGIPKDKRDIIFDPFRQVDQSTTRKYSGTGIGLTITKKLALMLGGNISLESNDEKGSLFCCNFPLQNSTVMTNEPKEQDATKTNKLQLDLSGKTVIIAEDFESNYLFLKAALKNSKANIIWCKNGEETLKALNNGHSIDLILMDVQMPVMSGNDAVVKIRKSGNDIPIIAQTAYATNKELEACMKAGYNDYLVKPIRVKTLLETIARYL